MLNSKGFDEWAAGYDASVRHSHDAGEYPFAGYDAVLSLIEARVNSRPGADVLDLGFGTGMLTARLYAAGHPVAGVDFSQNMLDAARAKMPCAELYLYDFTRGLPPALEGRTFFPPCAGRRETHVPAGIVPPSQPRRRMSDRRRGF